MFVNIFIPSDILNECCQQIITGYLFGNYERNEECSGWNINITALLDTKFLDMYLQMDNKRFKFDFHLEKLSLIGRLNLPELNNVEIKLLRKHGLRFDDVELNLSMTGNSFETLKLNSFNGQCLNDLKNIQIIFYEANQLMRSQSFDLYTPTKKIQFLNFLLKSLNETSIECETFSSTMRQRYLNTIGYDCSEKSVSESRLKHFEKVIQNFYRFLIPSKLTSLYRLNYSQMINRGQDLLHVTPDADTFSSPWIVYLLYCLFELLDKVTFRKFWFLAMLKFRLLQFRFTWKLFKDLKIDFGLSFMNLLFTLCLDHLLGTLLANILTNNVNQDYMFELADTKIKNLIDQIKTLLTQMQAMPLGLKLNQPLNQAVAQAMFYHIYLWENFVLLFEDFFPCIINLICYSGFFGITFTFSLLSDLFTMSTVHIFCFYGYASLLFNYQISGIMSLSRLFRGKKYNPLRDRIDSYLYENVHLFVGTIFFSIFIFLLPTILMYYVVFCSLRLITMAVQSVFHFFIEYLSTFPLYENYLWLINSKLISRHVYFRTLNRKNKVHHGPTMYLYMETQPSSLKNIFEHESDLVGRTLNLFLVLNRKVEFEWNSFIRDILFGRMICQTLPFWFSLSSVSLLSIGLYYFYYAPFNV